MQVFPVNARFELIKLIYFISLKIEGVFSSLRSYLNIQLAGVPPEPLEAAALVARNPVQTGPVVETRRGEALVHVDLQEIE